MLTVWVIVLLSGFIQRAYSQNVAITEPQLMYRKMLQYGLNLNSTGIGGLNFRYGWHKTDRIRELLDFEVARIRDPKETRVYGASDNPQRYTYDRLYMAFFIRTGYGRSIMITDRPYKNALGLHFNYNVGLTTALLKPIYIDYLEITYDNGGNPKTYVNSVRYNPDIHNNPLNILGNSPFFYGISNTMARFGAYARTSLSVQFGQYPDEFYVIEGGISLDAFPDPLPLMANLPRRSLFPVLFLGFSYGLNK